MIATTPRRLLSFDARAGIERARKIESARQLRAILDAQRVPVTTRISNHIRWVMKIFGLVVVDATKTTFAVK